MSLKENLPARTFTGSYTYDHNGVRLDTTTCWPSKSRKKSFGLYHGRGLACIEFKSELTSGRNLRSPSGHRVAGTARSTILSCGKCSRTVDAGDFSMRPTPPRSPSFICSHLTLPDCGLARRGIRAEDATLNASRVRSPKMSCLPDRR